MTHMAKKELTSKDVAKAKRLYRTATKLAEADDTDWPKVIAMLQEARRLGSVDAVYALGDLYTRGVYVKRDYAKGKKYWLEAAKAGNKVAAYNLGVSYEKGIGIEKDLHFAFRFYFLAALLGDVDGVYDTYRALWFGVGVPKDKELANRWREFFEKLGRFEDR
jgi:TPR repeat protein